MQQVIKEYTAKFLIEATKLTRLVDTIHERLADHQNTSLHDTFEVFLTGNRRETMAKLDDVLALDNSRRHRITRLAIRCSASSSDAARPEHEVEVDFAAPKTSTTSAGTTTTKIVVIRVQSDAEGWASHTLSEVEEQVERTWLHYAPPMIVLACLLVLGVLVLASQFVVLTQPAPRAETMWLTGANLDRIEALLAQRPALTDDQLREVATMQLRNILESQRPRHLLKPNQPKRNPLFAVALVVILGCILLLLATCYPGAVFKWGDEIERHDNMVHRRKTIWSILIAVTLVGVVGRLFFEGAVGSWFPR